MRNTILAVFLAFGCGLLLGRILLPVLHKLKFGQNIYELAPDSHKKKQGTPTMGGLVIAGAALVSGCIFGFLSEGSRGKLVAMFVLALANMGIGFADAMTKIRHKENQGLTAKQKLPFREIGKRQFFLAV